MSLAVVMRLRNERELLPHIAANLNHADLAFLCDGGSTDGTWEELQELAKRDGRIRVSQWPRKTAVFAEQADHMNFAFQQAREYRPWDFIHYLDADEISNIQFQSGIRGWLQRNLDFPKSFRPPFSVGYRFLYVAAGGSEYHVEVSRYEMPRLWNYVPHAIPTPNGQSFVLNHDPDPRMRLSVPPDMMILHMNWALRERFERKLQIYEQHHQQPRWYPDEKYPERAALPKEAIWYAPNGSPTRFIELFK